MIVKDEEANLPDCLAAVAALGDLVSAVCIYDTGSTDSSVEVAQAYGARVERGYWDGDFARARNAAAELANMPYVLHLDADERVEADVPALRAALEATGEHGPDAFVATVHNLRPDGRIANSLPQSRIVRQETAWYDGTLHEEIVLRPTAGARGFQLGETTLGALTIRHLGYADAAKMPKKMSRNVACADVALARLSDDESDDAVRVDVLVDRGRALRVLGRLDEAVANLEEARQIGSGGRKAWLGLEVLAEIYLQLGRLDEAVDVVTELQAGSPAVSYVNWLTVGCLRAAGMAGEALEHLRELDGVISASGVVYGREMVFDARSRVAESLGLGDEALSCHLTVMLGSGAIRGNGARLLQLWGKRPLDALADILAEEAGSLKEDLVSELRGVRKPGPKIADLLRLRTPALAPVAAPKAG